MKTYVPVMAHRLFILLFSTTKKLFSAHVNTRFCLPLIYLLLVAGDINAQKGAFLTLGFSCLSDVNQTYHTSQQGTVLAGKWKRTRSSPGTPGFYGDPSLGLHYMFNKHLDLCLSVGLSERELLAHDQAFMQRNHIDGSSYYANPGGVEADSGNFNITGWYCNPGISAYYLGSSPRKHPGTHWFMGGGIDWYVYPNRHRDFDAVYYHHASDERLNLYGSYRKSFLVPHCEIGYIFFSDNTREEGERIQTSTHTIWTVYITYSLRVQYCEAQYNVSQGGKTSYTDHFSESSGLVGLGLRIGGGVFHKPLDRFYARQYARKIVIPEIDSAKEDTATIPDEIRGRSVVVKRDITVSGPHVTIQVWDHGAFDGDIISLNLNGDWIFENDTLVPKRKTISADLHEGVNYLILHAVSEGTQKPCTAAIIIDDGRTRQQVILDSNEDNSGAIRIVYNKD